MLSLWFSIPMRNWSTTSFSLAWLSIKGQAISGRRCRDSTKLNILVVAPPAGLELSLVRHCHVPWLKTFKKQRHQPFPSPGLKWRSLYIGKCHTTEVSLCLLASFSPIPKVEVCQFLDMIEEGIQPITPFTLEILHLCKVGYRARTCGHIGTTGVPWGPMQAGSGSLSWVALAAPPPLKILLPVAIFWSNLAYLFSGATVHRV